MAQLPPADPFGGNFRIQPLPGTQATTRGASDLYKFLVALLFLYLAMRYVPNGHIIGVMVLTLAMLSTPDAVKGVSDMLDFISDPLKPRG